MKFSNTKPRPTYIHFILHSTLSVYPISLSLTLCAFSLARLFKSYAAQLDRADASADLRLHELAHLLAILVGVEHAVKLCRGVLGALEQGLEESWYEKKMRRMYGAG